MKPTPRTLRAAVGGENRTDMAAATEGPSGFDRFDLHPSLAKGLSQASYDAPRPIQTETLPAALEGRDILGLAQTGTGKTAAFAIPILDVLLDDPAPGPGALVLAPTRELASQIEAEFRTLARFTKLTTATVYGGVSQRGQEAALRRRPDVIVGCPGRILDLLNQGVLHLDPIDMLVLDEADHMFDMGFLPDLRRILAKVPEERQTMLFSATMPREIRGLAEEVLDDPHVVELADSAPAETIEHALYPVAEGQKRPLLEHMLDDSACETAIVFTRTKHRARRLARQLADAGHRAVGLQGNMSQSQRDRAMQGFRERRYDVLVATDIAARGIDVSGVSHVINFDVPNTPEAYTHRIGRTGRSEREGVACTFVTPDDAAWVRATETMIGRPIERRRVAGFDAADPSRSGAPARSGGRRGQMRGDGRGDGARRSGGRKTGRRSRGRRGGAQRTAR